MSIKRIFAVIIFYFIAVGGWVILGTAMDLRSNARLNGLDAEVRQLWGKPIMQAGPSFAELEPTAVDPRKHTRQAVVSDASSISVDLELEHRRKGLIWYPTYVCTYDASYRIHNSGNQSRKYLFHFAFPDAEGTYDAFAFKKNGEDLADNINTRSGLDHAFELAPDAEAVFTVHYKTRGIERWSYQINKEVGRVKDFTMVITTNFPNYDYIGGTMSADQVEVTETGASLQWKTSDRITRQHIGIEMPVKLNPGPLSTRMTFFAPVCLIFFFSLIAAITIVKKIPIHPMHFLFVACGFFAFHLLFAYMVDLIPVHWAFCISTATTLFLVTGYMKAALKGAFPVLAAVGGQLFFLVLFSYSFFLDGTTGLTVAVGSVITLAIIMRLTADVDWPAYFERKPVTAGPARARPATAESSNIE